MPVTLDTSPHLDPRQLRLQLRLRRYSRPVLAATAIVAAVVAVPLAQGRGRQAASGGPPPAVYRTEVPSVPLDVIVTEPTETTATLSIRSSVASQAVITWSPGNGRLVAALGGGDPVRVPLTGLQPNRAYQFRVTDGTNTVDGRFHTARAIGSTFQFSVQADSHLDGNTSPDVYLTTLRHMVASGPDFLVDLGDTFMVDKYPDYQQSATQYTAQRYYLSRAGSAMAVFLALGNHDGEVGWPGRTGTGMSRWARTQRERTVPPPTSDYYSRSPEGLAYAWHWGDALCVVLDPFVATRTRPGQNGDGWAWTLGRAQYDWLERTLRASRASHKFVFIHHLVGGRPGRASEARGGAEAAPFYEWGGANGDGTPGFATARSGWPQPIHQLLKTTGVDVVFHGHDHLYAYQEYDGVVYQAVPQPGHVRGDTIGSAADYGYKAGTILGSSGALRVTVSPAQARVEYVKTVPGTSRTQIAHQYILSPETAR